MTEREPPARTLQAWSDPRHDVQENHDDPLDREPVRQPPAPPTIAWPAPPDLVDAVEPAERLDVENTPRTPERLALTAGCRLLSGAGRTLATITHRSTGGHDASVSAADAALFARAVARHELATHPAPRSLAFFRAVSLADDGTSAFGGPVEPGASVTIRAELPLVVLVANAPHPLGPRPDATSGPVELLAWREPRTSGATARHPASRGVHGSVDRAARA